MSPGHDDAVLAVFRRQLREDDLGLDDNFYEHGGHSLIAFRVLAEFRRLFAVTPLLEDFAELNTARRMAAWLRQQDEDADEDADTGEFLRAATESTTP